jgi:transposase-like protein
MLERTYIQARQVARTLGIRTGTLAKWRRQGRGPKGWVRLSRTSVAYPLDEVERFIRELEGPATREESRKAG